MKQYCRYCAYCISVDIIYCTYHKKELDCFAVRRVNHCRDFILSEMGDCETGKQYRPRKPKPDPDQITF